MKSLITKVLILMSMTFESLALTAGSVTFVDKDSYNHKGLISGVRVNYLEDGNVSFNYCKYLNNNEGNLETACSIPIGSPKGYTELYAKRQLFDHKRDMVEFFKSIIVMGTVVTASIAGIVLLRSFPNPPAIQKSHVWTAGVLTTLLGGKMWLDGGGEIEENLKGHLQAFKPSNHEELT